MLRWLAVFAVILNIIYFAVSYSAESSMAPASPVVVQPAPALLMLSERKSVTVGEVTIAAAQKSKEEKSVVEMRDDSMPPSASDDVSELNESSVIKNVDTKVAPDDVEKLLVTDFVESAEAPENTVVSDAVVPPPVAAATESCWEIGRFASEAQAKEMQTRLVVLGHELQLQKRSLFGAPDYWVFLGPYNNRRQALVAHRDLQARKIDSFLISEGELENAVSLGLFSLESGAQKMQQQRKKQGLDAQMRAVPRLRNEWWGVMRYPAAQLPDSVREKIRLDSPDPALEIKTLACESIANMSKLD